MFPMRRRAGCSSSVPHRAARGALDQLLRGVHGGRALLVLAACFWLIEVRGFTWWTTPFVILGVNALAVFFLHALLAIALARVHVMDAGQSRTLQAVLYEHLFAPWPQTGISLARVYARERTAMARGNVGALPEGDSRDGVVRV